MGVPEWDDWPHDDVRRPPVATSRLKKAWMKQYGTRLDLPRPRPPLRPIRLPPPATGSWRAPKRGLVAALRRRPGALVVIVIFILLIQTLRGWSGSEASPQVRPDEFPEKGEASTFAPGHLNPPSTPCSKMLVVARTSLEDTSWVTSEFNGADSIQSTVYVVDDATAPNHPPANKGHEAMVYLSYIIDHYHNLSDVTIFMHAHQLAWHNSELLDNNAATMVRHLSGARVAREGYVNLRCEWTPGCPAWLHPLGSHVDVNKKEEKDVVTVWAALFPGEEVPEVLAQPCCAQFAVARERILERGVEKYVQLREWLLRTELSDYISGRVWEYTWQYLFTKRNVVCPAEHVCYCDVYGVCFGGEKAYKEWWTKMYDKRHLQDELRALDGEIMRLTAEFEYSRSSSDEEFILPEDEQDRKKELEETISQLTAWLVLEKKAAFDRGDDPEKRAQEAGRKWEDGDGF